MIVIPCGSYSKKIKFGSNSGYNEYEYNEYVFYLKLYRDAKFTILV